MFGDEKAVKMNGISFTGASYKMAESELDSVDSIGANWVCWMPYSYMIKGELVDSFPRQWWGESAEGISQSISWTKKRNIKSFVKPHIWFTNGTFNGDFVASSEEEWIAFEASYSNYILKFAKLAEVEGADLFSIGVELKMFITSRPEYWLSLIDEVRAVYHGKITYSANWDNYKNIPFWKKLDYIGIDAYFPYSLSKTPTVSELKVEMEKQAHSLEAFATKNEKEIIFTEYGFRSEDNCCEKPWEYKKGKSVNNECQKNAYDAFFQVFYSKPWFKGGFIWKWFASGHYKEENQNGYFFKGKPVEKVIKRSFVKEVKR